MRETLVILLVIGACVAGMHRPRIALIAYVWFAIMRPDVLAWAEDRPYSLVLGIVALFSCLREFPYLIPALRSRWLVILICLFGWMALSVLFSPYVEESFFYLRIFFPTLITALLVPVVLRTAGDLRILFMVMAFSLGFLGMKFGAWGVMHGGVQFTGGYGGSLSDNNLFALGMVIGLPLCWFARQVTGDYRLKLVFLGCTALMLPAIIMTHSRGGVVALAAVLLFIAWYSKRRVLTFALLGILLIPSVYLVKTSFAERIATLSNVDEDASAQNRLIHWRGAFRLALDHPVTGVGFGGAAYVRTVSDYLGFPTKHYAHNNYLQMLADSGFPAFAMLCVLLFGQILHLRYLGVRFRKLGDIPMSAMALGMCGALIGFAVGSVFLSRTYYETIYYMFVFTAAYGLVAAERLNALESATEEPVTAAAILPEPIPSPLPEAVPARYKLGGRERMRQSGPAAGSSPRS
ncbi:MAG: O-antigen ligase family protein [Bryobacteraceae bacterium]|nr:O-antigen ligase family protein [Bryobacteraceae bacterium]